MTRREVATVPIAAGTLSLCVDNDGRYRWYDVGGTDLECSGATVAEAAEALLAAYPDDNQWTDEGVAIVHELATGKVSP